MENLSLGLFITITLTTLGVYSALIGLLIRALTRASAASTTEKLSSFKENVGTKLDIIQKEQSGCEKRCGIKLQDVSKDNKEMRDRWEHFVEKHTITNATRERQNDALFRIVDDMKKTMTDIKPALSRKMEDSARDTKDHLKMYFKDFIRDLVEKEIAKNI